MGRARTGDKHERSMFDDDDGYAGHRAGRIVPRGRVDASALHDLRRQRLGVDGRLVRRPTRPTRSPIRRARRRGRSGSSAAATSPATQPDWARPAYRWKTDPETFNHAIGFRCARDVK